MVQSLDSVAATSHTTAAVSSHALPPIIAQTAIMSGSAQLVVYTRIAAIDAAQWDQWVRGDYPFLQHAFLLALEATECVGAATGWLPHYLTCWRAGQLVGALPLYEKHHSWGEFVFDQPIAAAFHQYGRPYYPKFVNAIPFTPAGGQRCLTAPDDRATAQQLITAARELAQKRGYSGVHCLFPDAIDFAMLNDGTATVRSDCQYHWHNRGYANFEAFLAALKAKKRKNIRQERRKVTAHGLHIRAVDGDSLCPRDLTEFTRLYTRMYDDKYGRPMFNQRFFTAIAAAMPKQICLLLAERAGVVVAAAWLYHDHKTLYGRHWGCAETLDCLHFELCYYRGIEFCIDRQLSRFDPGAQGEHKIARGFIPTETRSLHWMLAQPFTAAIQQFAARERAQVARYIAHLEQQSPYLAAPEH